MFDPDKVKLEAESPVVVTFVLVTFVVLMFAGEKLVAESEPTARVVMMPFSAKRLVVVAFVEVVFVKIPVEAEDAPMALPLIDPPEMVSPSTTYASLMVFDGRFTVPVIASPEADTPPLNVLVVLSPLIVVVADVPTFAKERAVKCVVVALVNTPVEAVDAPIGVALIDPPLIVSPSTTFASVITPVPARDTRPDTYKLVVVAFVEVVLRNMPPPVMVPPASAR